MSKASSYFTRSALFIFSILLVGALTASPALAQHHDGHDDHDDDRFRRNSRYDRRDVYQIAFENGYRIGFHHGEEDYRNQRSFDYSHGKEYKKATWGYRGEYRDKDFYKSAFREGYYRGYTDAYRGQRYRIFNRDRRYDDYYDPYYRRGRRDRDYYPWYRR